MSAPETKPSEHLKNATDEQKARILELSGKLDQELRDAGIETINADVDAATRHLAEELGAKTSDEIEAEFLAENDLSGIFDDIMEPDEDANTSDFDPAAVCEDVYDDINLDD